MVLVLDRPTEAVSEAVHAPALIEPAETLIGATPPAPGAGIWPTIVGVPRPEPSSTAVPTTILSRRPPGDQEFAGLLIWLALLAAFQRSNRRRTQSEPVDPGGAVERIREWTGLSVAGVAELMGVARRSLYHWTTGATRPRDEARLLGLARVLQAYAGTVEPWELRRWLTTAAVREAVRSGDMPRVRRALGDALRSSTPPQLQPARPDLREEVVELAPSVLYSHYLAAAPRRTARSAASKRPLELTDSPVPENE